jgi:hypothetical protein
MKDIIDLYLEKTSWSQPYTKEDLIKAISFGEKIMLDKVKEMMYGMVVNGTCQSVLTEDKFKELSK